MTRRVITQSDKSQFFQGNNAIQPDDYLTKVLKYIPAEIIAAYVAIQAGIASVVPPIPWLSWVFFAAFIGITPVYIWRVARVNGTKNNKAADVGPSSAQLIISSIAFILWAMVTAEPFKSWSAFPTVVPTVILPLFTLFVPLVAD